MGNNTWGLLRCSYYTKSGSWHSFFLNNIDIDHFALMERADIMVIKAALEKVVAENKLHRLFPWKGVTFDGDVAYGFPPHAIVELMQIAYRESPFIQVVSGKCLPAMPSAASYYISTDKVEGTDLWFSIFRDPIVKLYDGREFFAITRKKIKKLIDEGYNFEIQYPNNLSLYNTIE
jgi:hypothetical protein